MVKEMSSFRFADRIEEDFNQKPKEVLAGYLPTPKAVKGQGYSAEVYTVGPEGGQVLVNETVKRINQLWD